MWGKSNLVNINLHGKSLQEGYENICRHPCEPVVEYQIITDIFEKLTYEVCWDTSYIVLQDFYVRNQKLYLRSAAKSLFAEWITSLRLLCTSFFKILSNEIYCEAPAKLRLRAIVCTVVVPTVALMGLLMPLVSYYFNRIVGDLDCWMNGFDNNDIVRLSLLERQTRSGRCFAIDLQPYDFIGQNPNASGDIYIYSLDSDSCVPILVDDIRRKYLNGDGVMIRDRASGVEYCITKSDFE